MAKPYPDATVTNKEIQWTGGKATQSHLAAMEILPNGDIFWGAGNTSVGGASVQKLLKGNVFSKAKVSEISTGKYSGFASSIDPNGKMHFSYHIVENKMVRYSDQGISEAETINITPLNFGVSWICKNMGFNSLAKLAYVSSQQTTSADHAITAYNYETMGSLTNVQYAGSTPQPSSIIQDPYYTGKIFSTYNINQITRFLASPPSIDVTMWAAPQSYFYDYILDTLNRKGWACSEVSGSLKRFNMATPAIEATFAIPAARSMVFDGTKYIFIYQGGVTGSLTIFDVIDNIIVQTIPNLIIDVGSANQSYIRYYAPAKTVVVSNMNNPGSNNVSFIELEPLKRRNRRSGSEIWAIIPEIKDYL